MGKERARERKEGREGEGGQRETKKGRLGKKSEGETVRQRECHGGIEDDVGGGGRDCRW